MGSFAVNIKGMFRQEKWRIKETSGLRMQAVLL